MERNTQRMQEVIQGAGNYHVTFGLDAELVAKVVRECESPALKGASSWYRFLKYRSGERFYGFSVDGVAFLMGSFARDHFRLAEIAVSKDSQGKGYGTFMLAVLFEECKRRGINTVTLRTAQRGGARRWYESFGAKIVGVKDKDYEMRIEL